MILILLRLFMKLINRSGEGQDHHHRVTSIAREEAGDVLQRRIFALKILDKATRYSPCGCERVSYSRRIYLPYMRQSLSGSREVKVLLLPLMTAKHSVCVPIDSGIPYSQSRLCRDHRMVIPLQSKAVKQMHSQNNSLDSRRIGRTVIPGRAAATLSPSPNCHPKGMVRSGPIGCYEGFRSYSCSRPLRGPLGREILFRPHRRVWRPMHGGAKGQPAETLQSLHYPEVCAHMSQDETRPVASYSSCLAWVITGCFVRRERTPVTGRLYRLPHSGDSAMAG